MSKNNDFTNFTDYTLIYCMMHDEGCVIKGHHDYVPYPYDMQHSSKCESCDWYEMGVISYNGKEIKIKKDIRVDYSRYGGGYQFNMYNDSFTNEVGKPIIFDEESPIYVWFETVSSYTDTFDTIGTIDTILSNRDEQSSIDNDILCIDFSTPYISNIAS